MAGFYEATDRIASIEALLGSKLVEIPVNLLLSLSDIQTLNTTLFILG